MISKIKSFIIFSTLICLLLFQGTNAFIVYLKPPRMYIRMNVTPGEYSFGEGVLEVKNLNNKTVNVEFIPQGYFADNVVFDSESKFDLQPNEGKNFTFKVKYNQPGIYNETMYVKYTIEGQAPVDLQSDIKVIAFNVGKPKNNVLKYTIIGFIVLIIIISLLFIFFRGGVKK